MSKQDVYEVVLKPMRAVFSPPSHVARDDEAQALEEYADALKDFDARDLEKGWRKIRDTHKRAFWPPIGTITEACAGSRKERTAGIERINGRMVDGEFQPWGGGCRCRRCRERTPTPGFYRAPPEFVEAAERTRKELDDWTAYKAEQLPRINRGESVEAYRARVAAYMLNKIATLTP